MVLGAGFGHYARLLLVLLRMQSGDSSRSRDGAGWLLSVNPPKRRAVVRQGFRRLYGIAASVAVCVLACVPRAQEGAPAFGLVLDLKGDPVARAEVHLLGGLLMAREDEQSLDELRLVTDARGRFVAALLPGRCYSVRAYGVADEFGGCPVSRAAEQFTCGARVELVLDQRTATQRVEVIGAEPWLANGALRLEVGLDSRWTRWFEVPIGADGAAQAPYLPPGLHAFVVRDGAGEPLCVEQVPSRMPARIVIPAPLTTEVRTIDARGAPLAGIEICALVGMFQPSCVGSDPLGEPMEFLWRRSAVTDAVGRGRAVVPAGRFVRSEEGVVVPGSWMAVRPGIATAAPVVAAPADAAERPVQLNFVLPDPAITTVHLVGTGGEPLVDARVLVRPGPRGAGPWCGSTAVLRSDANGTVSLPAAKAGGGKLRFLLEVPDVSGMLDLRDPALTADGSVSLRSMGQLDVQVVGVDGRPAVGYLLSQPLERTGMAESVSVLDTAGRARLRLWPGAWLLFACHGDAAGWVEVTVAGGTQERREIHMAPLYPVSGRVLTAAGEPVVGAAINASMFGPSPLNPESPEEALVEGALRRFDDRRRVSVAI